jgi:hypothetical protein
MRKALLIGIMVVMGLVLAGCGAHEKNALDYGVAMYKQGDCAGAQTYLDATIAQPDETMDLAYAYFLKGKCAEKAGDAAGAYENYYAAKIVVCFEVTHNTDHENLNTYARSDYCERILPEMLSDLAPDVGPEKIAAIEAKVNQALNARYMEQFATKK